MQSARRFRILVISVHAKVIKRVFVSEKAAKDKQEQRKKPREVSSNSNRLGGQKIHNFVNIFIYTYSCTYYKRV